MIIPRTVQSLVLFWTFYFFSRVAKSMNLMSTHMQVLSEPQEVPKNHANSKNETLGRRYVPFTHTATALMIGSAFSIVSTSYAINNVGK
jgi:hypothetical protein